MRFGLVSGSAIEHCFNKVEIVETSPTTVLFGYGAKNRCAN
jgi:hypothetical protein